MHKGKRRGDGCGRSGALHGDGGGGGHHTRVLCTGLGASRAARLEARSHRGRHVVACSGRGVPMPRRATAVSRNHSILVALRTCPLFAAATIGWTWTLAVRELRAVEHNIYVVPVVLFNQLRRLINEMPDGR